MLYYALDSLRDFLSEHGLYRYFMVLDRVTFRALFASLISFTIMLALGKRFIRWLISLKIGDMPRFDVAALDRAMESKTNTPTMGGLLIALSIIVSTVLLADLSNSYVQMALILIIWMTMLGGADDWLKLTASRRPDASRQGLYSWEKLVFQLAIGLVLGWFIYSQGDIPPRLGHVLNLPFQRTFNPVLLQPEENLIYLPRVVFIIITMLMIAGMSNAVNITDGMDGLATGITSAVSISLIAICLISGAQSTAQSLLVPYVPASEELAVVSGALAGAALGFLWWNCSPASVFMGDTGSLCLGGLIGYVAVVTRQEAIVLLMCGVFLLEIGSVVMQVGYFKWTKGKRIFRCAPYHWHLHMGGWTEQKIVARLWIVTVILIGLALASLKVR